MANTNSTPGSTFAASIRPELQRLALARDARDRATGREQIEEAEVEVRAAAEAARDADIAWTEIGHVLGMARGNAYHKYRRRPVASQKRRVA